MTLEIGPLLARVLLWALGVGVAAFLIVQFWIISSVRGRK